MKKPSPARVNADGLDMREMQFVLHYLANNGNGTRAARAAGFKGDTAARAHNLLKKPAIAAMIKRLRKQKLSALDAQVDRVLRELVCIAFLDPRKLFKGDGSLISLSDLDAETAAAISSVEVRRGVMAKLKFVQKAHALDLLGRYLNMWEGMGQPETNRLQEFIDAMRGGPVADTPPPSPPPVPIDDTKDDEIEEI